MLVSQAPWMDPRLLAGRGGDDRRIEAGEPTVCSDTAIARFCPDAGPPRSARRHGSRGWPCGRSFAGGGAMAAPGSTGVDDIGRVPSRTWRRAGSPTCRASPSSMVRLPSSTSPASGRRSAEARRSDQARGPPSARVRRQQAAQPRVPRRRRTGRGRRHARHDRPALVQPRAADRRGGGEGQPRRPPRAVRTTARRTRAEPAPR